MIGAFLAVLCGCTIQVGEGADIGERPVTPEVPSAMTDACEMVDQLPEEEMQLAAEAGELALAREGKSLADAWADPEAMAAFMRATHRAVGCDVDGVPTMGQVQQELHTGSGPDDYCGLGHKGRSSWWWPPSACLNAACRAHDACYAQCSARTSLSCMWGGPTAPCDQQFMTDMDCADESHRFASAATRFVARGLYAAGATALSCAQDMTCPGDGPCLLNRESEDCKYCLDRRDAGGACLQRACRNDLDQTTCYTANCPRVSGCFGGYNVPKLPSIEPPPIGFDPASVWSLSVVGAVIGRTKLNGQPWDVDTTSNFFEPDVVISVVFGESEGSPFHTTIVEDSGAPTWFDAPPLFAATAGELQTLLEFTAVDHDVIFPDQIATCSALLSPSDFGAEPSTLSCADDTGVLFTVFFTLTAMER